MPCVAAALAVMAWCMPNHQRPWTSFHAELVMAIAFLLAAGWSLWRHRRGEVRVPTLALVAAAATVIPLVQLFAGKLLFAGDFWLAGLYLLGFALALTLGYRLAVAESLDGLLGFVAWTLLAAGIVSVGLSLYQWQGLAFLGAFAESTPYHGRAVANLAQPNHLATLLVLGLCAVAWLLKRGRFSGAVAALLVVGLGFGLSMTQSRVGMLSATVLAGWLLLQRRRFGPRLAAPRLLAAYALVVGCVVAWAGLTSLGETGAGRSVSEVASGGPRLIHWTSMLDAIGLRPWTGYGWNQVALAQATVAPDHPTSGSIIEHSHNLVLDLLVWSGVPLGSALLGALVAWFWQVRQGLHEPAVVMALGMIGAVFLHGLVEFALEYSYFLLPIGLLMGAVSASVAPGRAWRVPRTALLASTAVVATLTVLVAVDYFALEEERRAIRFEEARIGLDTPRAAPPEVRLLTQLESLIDLARQPALGEASDAALERMRRVASRYPYGFAVLRYAAALALRDRPQQASAVLGPICKTHPRAACEGARAYWQALGAKEPRIAAVAGP